MHDPSSSSRLWWRWIAANAWAELVGLGGVTLVGLLIARQIGKPSGVGPSIAVAAAFVALGAFEGLVVGIAQNRVLRRRLPAVASWVGATVIGAMAAWALGMVPTTVMNALPKQPPSVSRDIAEPLRLLFGAGLGIVAGPVLAFVQWRRLRLCVPANVAGWWLPANAAAWAVGIPMIFIGAHAAANASSPALIALDFGLSLLAAGAAVGAIHGSVLVWIILGRDARGRNVAGTAPDDSR